MFHDLSDVIQDLEQAAIIQSHALSSPLPDDARVDVEVRYIPQELVGGDFYRIERLDHDHYVFMVADVTRPSFSVVNFASSPPISIMVSTFGFNSTAALA